MKNRRGFTLLELLIALAVFAIVATAAYSGLASVLNTRAAVEREATRLSELQLAWFLLERDLEQAAPRPIRDEFGQTRPALESGGLSDALLIFTRAGWDNPLHRPRSTLQRLGYRLHDRQLWRFYWNALDRGNATPPRETVLLDAVQEVRLRFLDSSGDWRDDWPPTTVDDSAAVLLPRAVAVTVLLDDWGEITRLFRLPAS